MSSFVVDKSHELINNIKNKNIAIDCTLGNGHDTLFLSSLFNEVHALDIQPLAISSVYGQGIPSVVFTTSKSLQHSYTSFASSVVNRLIINLSVSNITISHQQYFC